MYIKVADTAYPCERFIPGSSPCFQGVNGLPGTTSGVIELCSDDNDFLLASFNTEDYARQVYEGGVLTLTNEPPPEPIPEPEPQDDPLTLADIAEAILDLQVKLINMEMGVN